MHRVCRQLRPLLGRCGPCTFYCTDTSTHSRVGTAVADAFAAGPQQAAESISLALTHEQRVTLLHALAAAGQHEDGRSLNDAYVNQIFQQADTSFPRGVLEVGELKAALQADRMLRSANPAGKGLAPDVRTLLALGVATGIPFIGFGFLDNFIMITAGESLEASFGLKFGLSTMAAAGLGNIISDIAGLGFADQIEVQARKVKIGRPPELSAAQNQLFRTRAARVTGSAIGITMGCLLGMFPLLWLE